MEFGRFPTLMACSSIRLNTYSLLHVHTCQCILMCTSITFEEYVCTYFNTRLGSRAAVLQIGKRAYVRFVYWTAYMIILLCIHHNINIKTWIYNCIYKHIITCELLDKHIYLYMIMYTSDRFLGQLRWNCPQVNATEHLQWLFSIGAFRQKAITWIRVDQSPRGNLLSLRNSWFMVANGLSVSLQELSIRLDYMLIYVSSRIVCGVNLFIDSNSVSLTIVECIENTFLSVRSG